MQFTRRQALQTLAGTAIASTVAGQIPTFAQATAATTPVAAGNAPSGPFVLPPLPYAYDALEPVIDQETMHLHHDKHHGGYVTKLNEALAKEPTFVVKPGTNVDELLKNLDSVPESIRLAVRNQGGGHSNHSLFWQTLQPVSKAGDLEDDQKKQQKKASPFDDAIVDDLGGHDKLISEMTRLGGTVFGSGWVWLVLDGGKKLTILTMPNQDSPLLEGHYPLFGIDVWEHAYYLKYHNLRADYLKAIWGVINWDFISKRYSAAMAA